MKRLLFLLVFVLSCAVFAQRVDVRNTHYRTLAVDRVITTADGSKVPAHAQGKLGWVAIYNAEGTLALVEYVGRRYQDHDDVRADGDRRVKVFDKGKINPQTVKNAAVAAGFDPVEVEKFLEKAHVGVR